MELLRVYSIIVMLLTLFAIGVNNDLTKEYIIVSGILYIPVLVYLLYGGW